MNTEQISNWVAFGLVVICWLVFAGKILLRKRPKSPPDTKRAPGSWVGLTLQVVGFCIVWAFPRTPYFAPLIEGQPEVNFLLNMIAIFLSVTSVMLAMSAINELGKQWSIAARLIEGHKLVTSGVYSIVRHPIYTALLGLLLATGLSFSHWLALAAGMIVFLVATKIRTHIEEGLLRDAFGKEFEEWKAKVPGLIPFL